MKKFSDEEGLVMKVFFIEKMLVNEMLIVEVILVYIIVVPRVISIGNISQTATATSRIPSLVFSCYTL